MSSTTAGRGTDRRSSGTHPWLERFESPAASYYALMGVTAILVVFGLIMVLSASTIKSLTGSGSPYSIFLNQLLYAVFGTVVLVVASRQSVLTWKRLALPVMAGAIVLQLLVFSPLGVAVQGNRNWLGIAGFRMQPSELVKIGLVLSGALFMSVQRDRLSELKHVVVPYLVPISALSIGLVVLGHDLGTALILAAIVGGVLYTAGVPGRWFLASGAAFVTLAVAMVLASPNRLGRFDVWLGKDTDPTGPARQAIHGRYALADGGWFGLGLGRSREKWNWLPEAHNDFIFAIIGEEFGLPGTIAVLLLFALIALICYRLVMRSQDLFVRVATAGIMAWIMTQALINIGAVIGLLPIIGVPLPLVSSGGSSLVTTMFALGILMSFARAEPGCAEVLAARPSIVRRSLAVLPTPRRKARR